MLGNLPSQDLTPWSNRIISAPLRVLMVDDEPRVLQGLERMLRPMRNAWEMRFAGGGEAALATLEQQPADVVVSDMRMPGMSGGQLLGEVMRRWPSTIRIILSGHADLDMVHRTIGPTHQFLQKPCEADVLKRTVQRVWMLRTALSSEPLCSLVGGMQTVPSLPSLHNQLASALADPTTGLERLAGIIAQDLGMSARVLQLVNSAFFGTRRRISDPTEAVGILGVDAVRGLASSSQAFIKLETGRQMWFDPDQLWLHSQRVSRIAREAARRLGLGPEPCESAAVAGLLHDVGHLLLAAYRPREFAILAHRVRDEGDYLCERLVLGSTHGEVAAYLLGLWGFPAEVVDAVACHHQPWLSEASSPTPTTCVHIADAVSNSIEGTALHNPLSVRHLEHLGLDTSLDAWMDLAH